jgi:hypothetical protein
VIAFGGAATARGEVAGALDVADAGEAGGRFAAATAEMLRGVAAAGLGGGATTTVGAGGGAETWVGAETCSGVGRGAVGATLGGGVAIAGGAMAATVLATAVTAWVAVSAAVAAD